MTDTLTPFTNKKIFLREMTTNQLSQIRSKINRERFPWKVNFLFQLTFCKLRSEDCFPKYDPSQTVGIKRDVNDDDDHDHDGPKRTRGEKGGKKKSKKSRRNRKKSKSKKTLKRKTQR
jgi:hypothetical protein